MTEEDDDDDDDDDRSRSALVVASSKLKSGALCDQSSVLFGVSTETTGGEASSKSSTPE